MSRTSFICISTNRPLRQVWDNEILSLCHVQCLVLYFIYLSIRFQINIQMFDQKQWHYIHQKMSQNLKRRINAFCSEKPSCERVEGRIVGDIGSSSFFYHQV